MKKYQRLELDIKHEYEQKTLLLTQELESEVIELSDAASVRSIINAPASNLLLSPFDLSSADLHAARSSQRVRRAIDGDIHYTLEDERIIDLFRLHAEGLESVTLKSDLELLKDESAPEDTRLTAKQKVASFLHRMMPIVGETFGKGSLEYLQKVIVGS